jgi:2-keto-4-pentenoate hydratase/2-oxohepta-3-ene-1,7-dioic acid hydratase in catechol pathway
MKIICIGLNYREHIAEFARVEVPHEPVFFIKPDTALLIRNRPFYIPDFSQHIDYEAEVVVKISRVGKNIQKRFAHRYYEELTVGIDFTARDLQNEARRCGLPWTASKGFDNSAAVGTFVNKSKLPPVDAINFHLLKNGQVAQSASTAEMINGIDAIIAHVSRYMTLHIGDLIFTGTPSGVAQVVIGDRLELFLENQKLLYCNIK